MKEKILRSADISTYTQRYCQIEIINNFRNMIVSAVIFCFTNNSLPLFNQGAIPLGSCVIEPTKEQGHPFAIQVQSDEFNVSCTLF